MIDIPLWLAALLIATATTAALLVTRIGAARGGRYVCGTCQARHATDHGLALPETDPSLTVRQQRKAVRIVGGNPRRYIPDTWHHDGWWCAWAEQEGDSCFSWLAVILDSEHKLLLDELRERR